MRIETHDTIQAEIERAKIKYPDGRRPARVSGLRQEIGEVLQALEKVEHGLWDETELVLEIVQLAGQCVRYLEKS